MSATLGKSPLRARMPGAYIGEFQQREREGSRARSRPLDMRLEGPSDADHSPMDLHTTMPGGSVVIDHLFVTVPPRRPRPARCPARSSMCAGR